MQERTGAQMAAGLTSIAFGLMGLIQSALLFALGPAIAADMLRENTTAGSFTIKLPMTDAASMQLELAIAVAWVALIVAGAGVLRFATWSRSLSMITGIALCAISAAKMIDGGVSYGELGVLAFGAVIAAVFIRAEWSGAAVITRAPTIDSDIVAREPTIVGAGRRAA